MPDVNERANDQPVHKNGFWFVMKWVFLFLVSLLLMSQLAILLQFRTRDFLKPNAFGFLAVSSFLTSFVLNVILDLALRSMASPPPPTSETEPLDDQP